MFFRTFVLALALGAAVSVGLGHGEEITNWAAPPFWSPDVARVEKPVKGSEARPFSAEAVPTGPLPFFAIRPCRIVDTRPSQGFPLGYGPPILVHDQARDFDLNSSVQCQGIPANAEAYSLNLTVTETQGPGDIRIWPAGNPFLNVSTQNWPAAGTTIANAAIVAAGTDGAVTVVVAGSDTHLIIDINGYYAPIPIVNTVNGLSGNLTLSPGPNIQITPSGNTLTIGAAAGAIGWSLFGNSNTNPGTHFLGTTDNKALEIKVDNARALLLQPAVPAPNVIGGFSGNSATAGVSGAAIGGGGGSGLLATPNVVTDEFGSIGGGSANRAGDNDVLTGDAGYATVAGGLGNTASGWLSTVSGGRGNVASADATTVAGGEGNTSSGSWGFVGGGRRNTAGGRSTVGGGEGNLANGDSSVVAGGYQNAAGTEAVVSGGRDNIASGQGAIVPGGDRNTAAGAYSFAAGKGAKANHTGAFVWGDALGWDLPSAAVNEFRIRATGGVAIVTAVDGTGGALNGAILPTNGGAWSYFSNRNAKHHFSPVSPAEILDRVANLPLATWSYRSQDPAIRHIGPVAQDFASSFGFGENEEYINSADADGVALAAIQGLHQIVQEKSCEVEALRAEAASRDEEIRALRGRLERIERQIGTEGKTP